MSKEQDAKREALAKAACEAGNRTYGYTVRWEAFSLESRNFWLAVADFILAREAEREGPLVEALRDAGVRLQYLGDVVSAPRVWDAVRRWEALDAPPQRTLAEVAKDVVMTRATFRCAHTDGHATVSDALLDELAEALKREEGKR